MEKELADEIWENYKHSLPIAYSKLHITKKVERADITNNSKRAFELKKYPVEFYPDYSLYKNISITNDDY